MSNKGSRGKIVPVKSTKQDQIESMRRQIAEKTEARQTAYDAGVEHLRADIENVARSMRTAEGARAILAKDIKNELDIYHAAESAVDVANQVEKYLELMDGIEEPKDFITCFDNVVDGSWCEDHMLKSESSEDSYVYFVRQLQIIEFYSRFGKQGYEIAMSWDRMSDEIKGMESALAQLEFPTKQEDDE